jgi:hypothetical protein
MRNSHRLEQKRMKYESNFLACGLIIFVSIFVSSPAHGQSATMTDGKYSMNVGRKLSVGVGFGYVRFDTNFKFTDKSSGRSVYVDAEGTLGLPEAQSVPMIYGYWRASEKHGIGFSFFKIDREATLFAVDENLGDLTLTGKATLSDKTRFYYVSYNYTAYQDARSYVFLSLGLYGIDLKYRLDATGNISFQGAPVASGEYSREVRQFAPLPLIGIDAWFALTPKWAIGTKVSLVAGRYEDVSAAILETRVRAKYAFNQNLGLYFGINYFQGEVDINEDNRRTEISYGFDGVIVGLDVGF